VLQQLNYLDFIDIYHERIKVFHVKDAEFRPDRPPGGVLAASRSGKTAPGASVRWATARWTSRPIFSKMAQNNFKGWAVLEWECCLKHPEQGAAEGASFIRDHIIRVTEKAFDDFAGGTTDPAQVRRMLGLS
jgi:sugar phosphate isomerase/epimerase